MISTSLEQWPLSGVATAAVVAVTVYLVLYRLQCAKHDPNEPPIIPSPLPFVGHLLGMALQGGRYTKTLGRRHRDKPIFTLPVPLSRIYIVTDAPLAAAVQRASRTLSFTPLVPDITKRVLGLDRRTVAQVRLNLDPEPGAPRGFLADMHDLVYAFLGPGDALAGLSLGAAHELAAQVNAYAATLAAAEGEGEGKADGDDVVNLLEWARHFVTVGTARFLYGPRNPVAAHPELEASFWDFVHGLGPLLMGVAPSVTARKPYRAREALVAAFVAYLDAGEHLSTSGDGGEGACALVRGRIALAGGYGWAHTATARSELSFLFAGIINTAVTTFWVVLRVFADARLLAAVRAELQPCLSLTTDADAGGLPVPALGIEAVRTRCPTLAAVFRESLRVGSDNFSTRLVKSDTLLAQRHFLRKDAVVQVAAGVLHGDAAVWGADAAEFDHRRFVPGAGGAGAAAGVGSGAGTGAGGVHPAAFRAFGGGKTLCPGRHFATSEILVFAAMIVLTFDMEAADGGPLRVPVKNDCVLPVHILEPRAEDVPTVRISLRKEGGLGGPLRAVP